jgi:NAD(P)-dependent dehydrogenase (short-subunit alcohol dehydrogenase family)
VVNYLQSEQDAQDVLTQIQKISQGSVIKCDVSDESQVKIMIQKIIKLYGRLDVLVNNV